VHGTGLWLQSDLTIGLDKVWHEGTLGLPDGTTTDWETEITVPRNEYILSWRAVDADGDVSYAPNHRWLNVRVIGIEFGQIANDAFLPFSFAGLTALPERTVLGQGPRDNRGNPIPSSGTGPTVRLSGAAYSELTEMIGFVEAAIQDVASGRWLQEDGSFGTDRVDHVADCPACPESPTAYWFLDAEFPDGEYTILALPGAAHGLIDDFQWRFIVDNSIADTPEITIDQPDGATFSGGHVAITGTASDNIGVLRVAYSILDDRNAEPATILSPPVLTAQSEPTTEWSLELGMTPGSYRLVAEVWDQAMRINKLDDWSFEVTD